MSSPTFIERFRDKVSTLTPDNLLLVNPQRVISKPSILKVHSPNLYTSIGAKVNRSISPNRSPSSLTPKVQASIIKKNFFLVDNSSKRSLNRLNKRSIEGVDRKETNLSKSLAKRTFQPYTLKDYLKVREIKYSKLGGLGPNVGSSEWLKKKYLSDKKVKYGDSVIREYKRKNSGNDDSFGNLSRKKLQNTFMVKVRNRKGHFCV